MDFISPQRLWVFVTITLLAFQVSLNSLVAYQDEANETALTPDEIYGLAAAFYSDQKWDQAAPQFRNLLENYPDHPTAKNAAFYLGESLVQLQKFGEAESVFTSYLKNSDDELLSVRTQFRLAECAYLNGKFEKAHRLFMDFLEANKSAPLAEFALPYSGELHLRFNEPETAFEVYDEAITRFPESKLLNKCRLGAAQSLNRSGSFADAEALYRKVIAQTEHDLADDALLLLAKMLITQQSWVKAVEELQSLTETYPDSPLSLEARHLIAKHEINNQNWQSAWNIIERLLNDELPENLRIPVQLDALVVNLRLEQLEIAEQIMAEVTANTDNPQALEFASVVEIDIINRRNQLRELETRVTQFEHKYPNSNYLPLTLEPLARKHYDAEEFAPAAARYQQLIALASTRPSLQPSLPAWHYLLGLSRIGTTEYKIAVKHLQAIDDFGGNQEFESATRFAIATAMSGDKNWVDAIPYYEEYLRQQPNGPDTFRCQVDLAVAFAQTHALEKAVACLSKPLEDSPDHPGVLGACELIAELALKNDNKALAKKYFQTMASASDAKIASRGANGLVWSGDQEIVSEENLKRLIENGIDKDLALEAILGRAQELQANDNHQQTVDILQHIVNDHADSRHAAEAQFRLAVSLQRLEGDANAQEANQLLETFIASNPDHALYDLAKYELGWAKHDMGDLEEAKTIFIDIADNYPESEYRVDACYRAAMLLKQLDQLDLAKIRLQEVITWEPNNSLAAYAHYTLGEFESQASQWKDAKSHFETVIKTTTNPALKAPAEYWLAESLYQLDQVESAQTQFESLQDTGFNNLQIERAILVRLAQCEARKEDWSKAETWIIKARQKETKEPEDHQLDYLQARVFMSRAKFNEAREMLKKVTQNDNAKGTRTAAMSQWMIGETWFHQEKFADALNAYLLVDSLYEFPDWQSLALLQAVKCHLKLGDTETAQKTCSRLISSFPDSPHLENAKLLLVDLESNPTKKTTKTIPAKYSN